MKLIKAFLYALCFLTLSQSTFSQNTAALKTDSICKTIDKQLIKPELSKKAGTTERKLSIYYFEKMAVIYKVDKQHLVKDLKTYLGNAKEYLNDPVIIH